MALDDPLRGGDLPPVPPTAPPVIELGDQPRHSLVGPAGDPIPPADTEVTDHIVDVDERLSLLHWRVARAQRDIVIVGVAVLIVLAVVLILGFVLYIQHNRDVTDSRAERLAESVERARVDGILRNGQCATIAAWQATYSTAGRDAYPGGTGRYDDLYKQLSQAADKLNCAAAG